MAGFVVVSMWAAAREEFGTTHCISNCDDIYFALVIVMTYALHQDQITPTAEKQTNLSRWSTEDPNEGQLGGRGGNGFRVALGIIPK